MTVEFTWRDRRYRRRPSGIVEIMVPDASFERRNSNGAAHGYTISTVFRQAHWRAIRPSAALRQWIESALAGEQP